MFGIFGKRKSNETITVSPDDKFLLWEVPTQGVDGDVTLKVESGCKVLCYVNGKLDSDYGPDSYEVNPGRENLKLLGYNADKNFQLLFGVGGIPYRDYEINSSTKVGMHGSYYARVRNAAKLCKAMGKDNVTADDVSGRIQNALNQIASTELAQKLQRYNYANITTQLTAIAGDIEKLFADRLDDIGLALCNLSVAEIYFPDEFIDEEKEHFDRIRQNRIDDDEFRKKIREQRAQIQTLKPLLGSGEDDPEQGGNKVCSVCGTEITGRTKYCPKCGKLLK